MSLKVVSSSSSSSNSGKSIAVLEVRKEKEFPGLLSFPQGIPQTIDRAKISAKRKRSDKHPKTNLQVDLDSISYKGFDYGEHSSKKNFHNYAVGVLGSDGKMKLYPCSQAFVMRPELAERESDRPVLSSMEKRESLTNEFGSKKKIRMMNAAKSNLISTDNISGANELQTLLEAKSSEMDISLVKAAEDVVNKIRKKKRTSY